MTNKNKSLKTKYGIYLFFLIPLVCYLGYGTIIMEYKNEPLNPTVSTSKTPTKVERVPILTPKFEPLSKQSVDELAKKKRWLNTMQFEF